MEIENVIAGIGPLDEAAMAAARARQDQLTKPRKSLGRLESLSAQLAGIMGNGLPRIEHKVIVTMAGDHGVVAEKVSAYPQEVTLQMVLNFLRGGAAINVLSRHVGARVVIVDMGVAVDLAQHPEGVRGVAQHPRRATQIPNRVRGEGLRGIAPHPGLVVKKVALGTHNIATGPAMSRKQALQAIEGGIQVVKDELARGLDILAVGEMGIGNTTPAAAIAVTLTGRPPKEIVGRGTGVDDVGLELKIDAVRRALDVNRPDASDALDVLSKVGGFEIGGMAGAMLCAAAHRRPVMVDGYISTAAAMIAVGIAPRVRDYLIASHRSQELGHHLMLSWLGLEPLLDLDLRLGEGTGAALGISLAEAACAILREMVTFDQAGVSDKDE
jgi:nicotinate-nucleotide--dimethylbenzimidazole phosphoribosyltransferase